MNKITTKLCLGVVLAVIMLASNAAGTTEDSKLLASDGAASDYFGYSVSVDGDTAIIGAYGNQEGAAYVFTRTGGTWTEQPILRPSVVLSTISFGISVSLDGDTAVIGADTADEGGFENSGAAYVFTHDGSGTWSQQAKLIASHGAAEDRFGRSVSVSGDTIIIGAYGDDSNRGAAYVFTRTGGTWSQQAKLTASTRVDGDRFGWSVSVDGDTAIIGAHGNDSYRGAAYVFTRTDGTWAEQQILTADDAAPNDHLGWSVSMDGDTAIIGANSANSNKGAAYVFTRDGSGTWSQQDKLTASDGVTADYFGDSVSVDGDTVIIGASSHDYNKGAAYVFTRTGTTWSQQDKLTASDGVDDDYFGRSVSLSENTAVIGAYLDDDKGDSSGSAYVFSIIGSTPIPEFPTIAIPVIAVIGLAFIFQRRKD